MNDNDDGIAHAWLSPFLPPGGTVVHVSASVHHITDKSDINKIWPYEQSPNWSSYQCIMTRVSARFFHVTTRRRLPANRSILMRVDSAGSERIIWNGWNSRRKSYRCGKKSGTREDVRASVVQTGREWPPGGRKRRLSAHGGWNVWWLCCGLKTYP